MMIIKKDDIWVTSDLPSHPQSRIKFKSKLISPLHKRGGQERRNWYPWLKRGKQPRENRPFQKPEKPTVIPTRLGLLDPEWLWSYSLASNQPPWRVVFREQPGNRRREISLQ